MTVDSDTKPVNAGFRKNIQASARRRREQLYLLSVFWKINANPLLTLMFLFCVICFVWFLPRRETMGETQAGEDALRRCSLLFWMQTAVSLRCGLFLSLNEGLCDALNSFNLTAYNPFSCHHCVCPCVCMWAGKQIVFAKGVCVKKGKIYNIYWLCRSVEEVCVCETHSW